MANVPAEDNRAASASVAALGNHLQEIPIGDIRILSHRPLRDVSSLIQSIQEVGLLHPIIVTRDNVLVAGYHRIEACKALGHQTIACLVRDYDDLRREYASISENLFRNEGTALERDLWTARLKELHVSLFPETLPSNGRELANRRWHASDKMSFAGQAARQTKQSRRTIERQARIGNALKEAGIDDQLRGTKIENNQTELTHLSKLPLEERKQVAEKLHKGEADNVTDAKKLIHQEELKGKVEEHAKVKDASVFHLDFRTAGVIPPDSIHLICTDPPYLKEYLHLWPALADFASVVLKPGGYLISYAPHEYLPEVIAALSTKLSYYWIIAVKQTGAEPRMQKKSVMVQWKPMVIFYKGERPLEHERFGDMLVGEMGNKELHVRAQGESEAAYVIEKFTQPGDVVLDPMCGSGTTLLAATNLGRRAVGIDIDPVACDTTKKELEKLGWRTSDVLRQ